MGGRAPGAPPLDPPMSSIGQTGLKFEFIQPSEHSEPHTSFCH